VDNGPGARLDQLSARLFADSTLHDNTSEVSIRRDHKRLAISRIGRSDRGAEGRRLDRAVQHVRFYAIDETNGI